MCKCSFSQSSIEFLGHIVSADGIAVHPKKVVAVHNLPSPTKLTEIEAFIGICPYYRCIVNSFAAIASLLTNLLRNGALDDFSNKDKSFVLLVEAERAFQKLKTTLTTTLVLDVGNFDLPWVVYPYAYPFAVGCENDEVRRSVGKRAHDNYRGLRIRR